MSMIHDTSRCHQDHPHTLDKDVEVLIENHLGAVYIVWKNDKRGVCCPFIYSVKT